MNFLNLDDISNTNPFKPIEKYIEDFPNLNEYDIPNSNSGEKINIFEIQKELDVPNKISEFFNNINKYLKNKIKNKKELTIINDKLYDYVMSRMYDIDISKK